MDPLLSRLKQTKLSSYEIELVLLEIDKWLKDHYPIMGALYETEILKKTLPRLTDPRSFTLTPIKKLPASILIKLYSMQIEEMVRKQALAG